MMTTELGFDVLSGHVSPDTAYVVDDYPYGFRLRCKIRYWLEFKLGKGYRFCSQTTNPKKVGEVWNRPKASTYSRLGGVMICDKSNGHVTWLGLSEYADATKCQEFEDRYGYTLPVAGLEYLHGIIAKKRRYEELKASGMDWQKAGLMVAAEFNGVKLAE
jgi:hypothetical protein